MHGLNVCDLSAALGAQSEYPQATPEYYVPRLQAAGLVIDRLQESRGQMHFADVGAIVLYVQAIPWVATGFTVDTHQDRLFALQDQIVAGVPLVFETRSYVIEARKI